MIIDIDRLWIWTVLLVLAMDFDDIIDSSCVIGYAYGFPADGLKTIEMVVRDSRPIECHSRPFKAIQGNSRPFKSMQGH